LTAWNICTSCASCTPLYGCIKISSSRSCAPSKKNRLGEQHYRRVFNTPTTPFERLCEIEALPGEVLSRLQTLRRQTNPIQLRQQIAALIEQLWAVPVQKPAQPVDIFQTLRKEHDPSVAFSFDLYATLR